MYTDSGRRTQRAGRPARAVHPGDGGRQREDRDPGWDVSAVLSVLADTAGDGLARLEHVMHGFERLASLGEAVPTTGCLQHVS